MTIKDLFSKRSRRDRGEMVDVFTYDILPAKLRAQLVHLITDAIGSENSPLAELAYEEIWQVLRREHGVFELARGYSPAEQLRNLIVGELNVELVLDAVELLFQFIDEHKNDPSFGRRARKAIDCVEAINDLNARFLENGVGYQFESGGVLRVDTQITHQELVKPALNLLNDKKFKGANEEFLKAHEHYRHGRHKESVVEALKAFESAMKAICDKNKWKYEASASAKALIDACFTNGLVPGYLQAEYSSLRSLLESGLPPTRNKEGGHGQGGEPIEMPAYVARYALNMAASNILFLFEADKVKSP